VRSHLPLIGVLLATGAFAHDEIIGARYVQGDGANASDCLDHDAPCQSIQFALTQAEPGNTVRVAAGIYDMTGVDPESFLFGTRMARGGYSEDDHFSVSEPDANRTILLGVDTRYRAAMAKQGFKWAADRASAERGVVDESLAPALQSTQAAAVTCLQGFAGPFPCRNVDFLAQIPLNSFSSHPSSAANLWGFVDLNDNREYAVIASVAFTHSGWPSADQQFLFFHDELEEIQRGFDTQIYTMNLSNLRTPSIVTSYQGPTTTTDHNGYTKGNFYYVSHYRRGLVVFDVSNPTQLREVAHVDTFLNPTPNTPGTDGAWGVYPFLPSGTILISDISNGLFVLKDKAAALANSAGQIGFIGTTATVSENAGTATVRLQRSGGYMGAVGIRYQTSDGTATTGSDYSATSGTLTWPALDTTERSFTVPLTNDTQTESDETFTIALSNASGGANIEGSPTFTITVTNDDVAASPPPPAAGSGGGGGGALSLDVLLLAALLLADVSGQRLLPSRSRKPDRTGSCRH
jgi:hypothetical protein